MAYDVIIVTDFQPGHVYPLFRIADNLTKNGFSICFVGVIDSMELVVNYGFSYFVILEELFPKGTFHRKDKKELVFKSYAMALFDGIQEFISKLEPKVVFSNSLFPLEALIIHYNHKVNLVMYHTSFPPLSRGQRVALGEYTSDLFTENFMGLPSEILMHYVNFFLQHNSNFETLKEIGAPLKEMPQVMLCPKEFNIFPSFNSDIHTGPCINLIRNQNKDLELNQLIENKKGRLIYASMGSQSMDRFEKNQALFHSILECMKLEIMREYHLILTVGSKKSNWEFDEIPENASVFKWVNQLEVLEHSTLAIIHGGLGTVKECIHYSVPMLVIPFAYDQFDNAKRVKHHDLGSTIDLDHITPFNLAHEIEKLLQSKTIQKNCNKMRDNFLKAENEENEVKLVRSILS